MIQGLTPQEVEARRSQGLGNPTPPSTTRSFRDILRANIFTTINIIVFTIALALALLGNIGDAVTSGGLVFINATIGILQELRAKRKLEAIALLNQPKAIVLRRDPGSADVEAREVGVEVPVDPSNLVKDDILVLQPGEQVVLDGVIVDGQADLDESLLTGESDLVPKRPGERVMSGSFCVTGRALYRAEKVGADNYANQLAVKARAFRSVKTPLQKEVDALLRLLMLIAAVIGFFMFVSAVVNDLPTITSLQAAAVIAGIVPNGLILAILVAYSLGAVRIAQRGALVQQTNAVESLSNVDILCTDKTGTLTANRIAFDHVVPLDASEASLESALGDMAASATSGNRTSEAISAALGGRKIAPADEVAFSSARKWSAVAFDNDDRRGIYAMGAFEMLREHLQPGRELEHDIQVLTERGLRVLVVAHHPTITTLHDGAGHAALPDNLVPLGLVTFSDELRPEARETIERFQQAGIRLKVISGDDPNTVTALARQAGLSGEVRQYSGPDLAQMPAAVFAQAAEDGTVFGRITPEQKEKLVDALRSRGHYVAMIGDGVNDVLSLKKANLGIAMQSGSNATRGVADMVLLNDSFAALAPAFTEGQRIVGGMRDILSLFLTRCFYVGLIILATGFVGVGFPFGPRNITLLTALTVGLPTIALAYWAKPAVVRGDLLRPVWSFVIPAVLTMLVFGLLVYVAAFSVIDGRVIGGLISGDELAAYVEATAGVTTGADVQANAFWIANLFSQGIITLFSLMAGLVLTVFIHPPLRMLAGGRRVSDDRRMTFLALGLFVVFVIGWNIPFLRRFFAVSVPPRLDVFLYVLAFTLVWAVVLLVAWRQRWFERFVLGRQLVARPAAPAASAAKILAREEESVKEETQAASSPQQIMADQGQS